MVVPHTSSRLPPWLAAAVGAIARSLQTGAQRCRDRLCLGTGDDIDAHRRERLLAAQALLARRVGVLAHDFEAALQADCLRLIASEAGATGHCPSPDELIFRWEQLAGVSADELALHSAAARLADDLAVQCAQPLRALRDSLGRAGPDLPATLQSRLLQPEQLSQALTQALEDLCDESDLRLLLCEALARSWPAPLAEACLHLAARLSAARTRASPPEPTADPARTMHQRIVPGPGRAAMAALAQLIEHTPERCGAPEGVGRLMRELWPALIARADAGDAPTLPPLPEGGVMPLPGTPPGGSACRAWALTSLLGLLPAVPPWPREGVARRLPPLMSAWHAAVAHLDWPQERRQAWLSELLTLHAQVLRQPVATPGAGLLATRHQSLARLAEALGCSLPVTWHPQPQTLHWSHWLDLARDRTRRQLAGLVQAPGTAADDGARTSATDRSVGTPLDTARPPA